ncbi:hypothetical protein BB561_001236 [Smittium simulii]|uniref:YCII-related domain-containing protein n=1 Tax=Smittium simulii TaxID=133385 RepID=A0A2T9YVN1_9FUNG|nr:hypothetical protein BB561_001236 [Smittium simulii]
MMIRTALRMNQYLVKVRDFKDAECINRRLAVRPAHFVGAKEFKEKNVLVNGGAIINGEGAMCGSFLLLNLESPDKVMELIKNDVYSTSKVWDLDTVEISQVKIADL